MSDRWGSPQVAMRPTTGLDAEYWHNRRSVMRYAYRCALCGGRPTEDDPLECGHKIPRSKGGSNALSNLQPEHRSCNNLKGNRTDAEFREYMIKVMGPRVRDIEYIA